MTHPAVRILPKHDRRIRGGSPWIFSNEIRMDEKTRAIPPGSVARLVVPDGKTMGLVHFNPHSLIAGRLLTRNKDATVDAAFVRRRLERALQLRERLFDRPHYRLVHAEADGLPGLVVDRMGDVVVAQLNTAGAAALESEIVDGLDGLLKPRAIVLRCDAPIRELEGLASEKRIAKGAIDGPVAVEEEGLSFLADVMEGQKTGWYFDQRDNRAFAARLGRGVRVLDLYSYSGGFGLAAISAGAQEAFCFDRSEAALELAAATAEAQGVTNHCRFERQDAFAAIDALTSDKERFGLVVADPPAFVRSKKDLKAGLRGYRKLARGSASLVSEAGFLAIACCSHNVDADAFAAEVHRGIRDAGRGARLLRRSGAGPDHPVHPALPESAYLKFLVYGLD